MEKKVKSLQGLLNTQPRKVAVQRAPRTGFSDLGQPGKQVFVVDASQSSVSLRKWAADHHQQIEDWFESHGVILFRGFKLDDADAFHQFTRDFSRKLLDYTEPSTPRTKVADKVYTSTEYPQDQSIPLHNEHSYTDHWPLRLWFYSAVPAISGGATPIADSREVYQLLSAETRKKFEEKQVLYVRNYSDELDLKWQEVFQTDDKNEVEQYCQSRGIEYLWKEDGGLRTKQVCQAVAKHPRTKEMLWFNQAHLFHVSNLDPSVQEYLVERYGEANLPRNTYYGDGTPIESKVLQEIRNAFNQASHIFPWQKDDVLMVDNMMYAHGRQPYEGDRKVLVAMSEPYSLQEQEVSANGQQAVNQARQSTSLHFINQEDQNTEEWLRYKLAGIYRIMAMEGLDEGISGHISFRVPNHPNRFWVNPFGLLFDEVTPENIITVDETGKVLEGEHPVNVAGFCIHAAIHEARPEVNCVVHTHSPWGTVFSSLDRLIEPVDQNCCMFFENHAIYEEYHGPVNDAEDAERLCKALGDYQAIILKNHGSITLGQELETAAVLMLAMERAYRVNLESIKYGNPQLVAPEVARMTKDWIANPIGMKIEFDAYLRKAERHWPDFALYRPQA